MKELVTFVPPKHLLEQFVQDIKDLNMKTTTAERQTAKIIISASTALLTRLGVIKTPSWSKRVALKLSKGSRDNLAVLNKTVVFSTLLLGNAVVKFGDLENEAARLFGVKLDDVQKAVDIAKVVLFEELIESVLDKVAVEERILKIGKASTESSTEA